jgi:hypothetical protein
LRGGLEYKVGMGKGGENMMVAKVLIVFSSIEEELFRLLRNRAIIINENNIIIELVELKELISELEKIEKDEEKILKQGIYTKEEFDALRKLKELKFDEEIDYIWFCN